MKFFRLLTTILTLTLLLGGCAVKKLWSGNDGPALSGRVTGTVSYRERIALPPDVKIVVTLEDISLKDASGTFIAQQTLRPKTQVPIAFDLRYIPSAIDRKHNYAVRAAILDSKEEVLWTSTEIYPVLFNQPEKPIAVTVERAANPVLAPSPVQGSVVGYRCDDLTFITQFLQDKVTVALAGRNVTLPQVISGSGARYSDGTTTFWSKGDTALFEMNGVSYPGCKAESIEVKK